MWVRRSDWERVTDMEELVGRLSVGSRFPQYLNENCISGGERGVGREAGACGRAGGGGGKGGVGGQKSNLLDDGNVHGSRGACAINLGLSHLGVKFEETVLTQKFYQLSREPQMV